MRFGDFRRQMKKSVFTLTEADIIAHGDSPAMVRLNLHRWVRRGEIQRLRRGVYAFADRAGSLPELIRHLYSPSYISLESALNQHGILPDVPFATTLVTPRSTRTFETPLGRFHFHRIDQKLFFGYDPKTLLAAPEKAILDYFYLRGASLHETTDFWREARFENLEMLDWKKGRRYADLYPVRRVKRLWESLKVYAKTA